MINSLCSSPRYDSPLPTLPPGQPIIGDEDIQNAPLPPIPPSYDDAMSDEDEEPKPRSSAGTNSAAGESGIDVDGDEYVDNGGDYIDDIQADSPFIPRDGNKPVAIEVKPETEVLIKGKRKRVETQL